jgi:hypothetical protein
MSNKDGFMMCEHNNLATHCKECFAEVFGSYREMVLERTDPFLSYGKTPHIHSPEFLRET